MRATKPTPGPRMVVPAGHDLHPLEKSPSAIRNVTCVAGTKQAADFIERKQTELVDQRLAAIVSSSHNAIA